MRTKIHSCYLLFGITLLMICMGCGKDDEQFPKTYKYSHTDQTQQRQYVLTSPLTGSEIDINTGSFGAYWGDLKEQALEIMLVAFELKQIDLLSENMVRIQIQFEEEFLDTTVSYSIEDENLVIESLGNSDLIGYDEEADEFYVCGLFTAVIPGPNVPNPGQQYNQYDVEECQDGANLNDYLHYVVGLEDYMPLDTVGIFITKLVYPKQ